MSPEARLAKAFVAGLRKALTEAEFADMRRRNRSPVYHPSACASHDFCDANMIMAEAFATLFARYPDIDSDADLTLWNRAWDIAKAQHLTEPE